MAKIVSIENNSPLMGKVRIGDDVIRFDKHPFCDILDYIYADSNENGTLTYLRDSEEYTLTYTKKSWESLGLEFDKSLTLKPKECHNNCMFCFVRQLPKGLRESLYVRDDDYRFSFISGSYITCTNMTQKDVDRIIEYKLSPLYVSVHATDKELHNKIIGVKKAVDQMNILKQFADNDIKFHTQIVLMGGINDGKYLEKSLNDLFDVGASTLAVVPVGLTKHREGLTELKTLTKEEANNAIDIVESFYDKHKGFCYCSDEMYMIAERECHTEEYFGEYEQIENGVGLVAKFISEVEYGLSISKKHSKKKTIGVFTGVSGEKIMLKARDMINKKYPKVTINIYPVKNTFFGETVTVTGLVTATSIIDGYGNMEFKEKYILIPNVMLREFTDVFLDNFSVLDLEKKLNKKIIVTNSTGEDFVEKVLYGDKK